MAKYLYNGVLFPEIPANVLATHPYAWIHTNAEFLYVSKVPWFCSGDTLSFGSVTAENKRYKLSSSSEEWVHQYTWNDSGSFTASVLWSNYDIPNGSATSTDIYFYGSEPVDPNAPSEPEEPKIYTHTIDFTNPAWKTQRTDVFSVIDGTTGFFVNSTLPYDGKQTLRSGAISHGGTSETTINFTLVADGSIELNYMVSSENNYDWLYIYVDNAEVVKRSGSVSWTVYAKDLSAGNHTVKFKYTKDGSGNSGSDAGAIGYVTLTGVVKDYDRKYLIQSGGSLFTVTDGALTAVEGSLNAKLFRKHGSDDIPASELLVTLTDPVVLYWVDTTEFEISQLVAVEQAVPFVQTVESPDYNMGHSSIVGIEKVLVDASDDCLFAVSFDSGQTWYTHTGQTWGTLSEGDTGMSPSALSTITAEAWNTIATTGKFRFRVTLPSVESCVNSLTVDYLN